jgi:hypothetical protein
MFLDPDQNGSVALTMIGLFFGRRVHPHSPDRDQDPNSIRQFTARPVRQIQHGCVQHPWLDKVLYPLG